MVLTSNIDNEILKALSEVIYASELVGYINDDNDTKYSGEQQAAINRLLKLIELQFEFQKQVGEMTYYEPTKAISAK